MGKNKKKSAPSEAHLRLPAPASAGPLVDTHTHLVSTFSAYRDKYPGGTATTIHDFVREFCQPAGVKAIVDVWCEAPVQKVWREIADSSEQKEKWGGVEYYFVMGVHPHEAKHYDDVVEQSIIEAMAHPRCVGWGEMGLDYHYDNSPRDVQQTVLERQLRHAVRLGKSLTIHTREAEEDTERILKAEVPRDHKIHVHCFTDSPEFAQRLLAHFPNLYIGITGVITYSTNLNTSALVSALSPSPSAPSSLRVLLETDAPFMVPSNLYASLGADFKGRLPLCHSGMVPWTAEWVAKVANGDGEKAQAEAGWWNAQRVMEVARENAREVYGV